MKQRWTPEEIALIKSGFLKGKLVKTIALEVGRSPTAVNKFLSRAGIRTRRWTIRKNGYPKQASSEHKHSLENSAKKQDLMDDVMFPDEVTTDFQEVLNYLEANGYPISRNINKAFAPTDDYTINDKPVSDGKLLILANRLRRENCQPVFIVPELLWD